MATADDKIHLDLSRGAEAARQVLQALVPPVRRGDGKLVPDPKHMQYLNETISMIANLVAAERYPKAPMLAAAYIFAAALAPMICPHIEGELGSRPFNTQPELVELTELFAAAFEQQLVMQHAAFRKNQGTCPKIVLA